MAITLHLSSQQAIRPTMDYGITDLGTFILGTIFIVLLPGPNSMYVMTAASRSGIAAGFRGALGIFVGDTILMVLAAGGAATLIQTTPALFLALKYSCARRCAVGRAPKRRKRSIAPGLAPSHFGSPS